MKYAYIGYIHVKVKNLLNKSEFKFVDKALAVDNVSRATDNFCDYF